MFFLKVHPSCESDPMVGHWWIALGKQCDLVSLPPFCCLSFPTLFKSSFRDLQSDKTGPDKFCCAQKLKRARKKENHSQTSGALENRFYSEKCIQRHTLPTHVKRTIKKKKNHIALPRASLRFIFKTIESQSENANYGPGSSEHYMWASFTQKICNSDDNLRYDLDNVNLTDLISPFEFCGKSNAFLRGSTNPPGTYMIITFELSNLHQISVHSVTLKLTLFRTR